MSFIFNNLLNLINFNSKEPPCTTTLWIARTMVNIGYWRSVCRYTLLNANVTTGVHLWTCVHLMPHIFSRQVP